MCLNYLRVMLRLSGEDLGEHLEMTEWSSGPVRRGISQRAGKDVAVGLRSSGLHGHLLWFSTARPRRLEGQELMSEGELTYS